MARMHVYLFVAIALSTSLAAAQNATAQLYGKWRVDPERTKAAMKEAGHGDVAEDIVTLDMKFEFLPDGKLTVKSLDAPDGRQGAWKTVKEDADTLIIEVDVEDKQQLAVEFLKDGYASVATIVPDDEAAAQIEIVLRRARE